MSYDGFEFSALAPYMDDFGETDVGLTYGAPQILYEKRYQELERLWLEHKIPEYIFRKLDSNEMGQLFGGLNW
jgi:hypothetical protein